MMRLTRRAVLTEGAAAVVATPALILTSAANAQLPAPPNLPSSDALLLRPGDAQFPQYQTSFNERTALTPQVRAMCKTPRAVGTMIDWCRSHNLAFALRCGGHSYEGLSQSNSVVIDTRLMNTVMVDAAASTATVGAGASLGALYQGIAPHGFAFPGGSCPTVGVSGHVLGGGYGYLARPFGLACDNLLSVDLVNAQGQLVHADAEQNADLYWACRGGGGGSFGAAVGYQLRLIKLASVYTFNIHLNGLAVAHAVSIMKEWQGWAPQAPNTIDSNFVITRTPNAATIDLRCAGQSIGSLQELRRELNFLSSSVAVVQRSFINSVTYFAGGSQGWNYPSQIMKGKSDYATAPMSDAGLSTLMDQVSRGTGIYVICDSYGGAVASPAAGATAFAHRNDTLYCLQYGSSWSDPKETPTRLNEMRRFYAAMRPYVSGAAYVNYCDLDLTDWQDAYWGENLARLKQIKKAFDPDNVFRHAQSVPPA
jgi:FAD/FMN-containing dehydrogenase